MATTGKPLAKVFGERLRAVREVRPSSDGEHHMSQRELAERASLHRTEIGLLENGRREPGLAVLFRLAGALGVSVTFLIGDLCEWEPTIGDFTVFERESVGERLRHP